jgi:hypothetical protein
MGRLIPQEESDAEGERDKVTEKRTEIEEKNGRHEDEEFRFQSPSSKDRREGFPNLIKDDRDREEETRIESQFEKGKESLGNGKGNQVLLKGDLEITQQCLGKWIESDPQ